MELHENDSGEFDIMIKRDGEYKYLCEKKNTTCSYKEF